jgi:L-lactate dehydrogenase complex protein LldF
MNPYTSMWTGVTQGDGPQAFHLVLLDNGRIDTLSDPVGRQALRCIKCSACLNVCPVYERVGGRAYGRVPGPIGRSCPATHSRRGQPAVRLHALRRLLRRVPGTDQHPQVLVHRKSGVDAGVAASSAQRQRWGARVAHA